jgi:hypothetical protein
MKISIDGAECQLLRKLLATHIKERDNGIILNCSKSDVAYNLFDKLQPEGKLSARKRPTVPPFP